jgi:hypothetical protein
MSSSIVGNQIKAEELTLKEQKMTPTIVIALGGSGKKSAINLRKLFFEKYNQKSLPIVDFLYLDTDVNEITIADENIYQLEQADIIDASIDSVQFEQTMSNLEGLHPHINKWFEKQKIMAACSGGVTDGAKKIRALGKLSFFLKYDEFVTKLEKKINKITSEPTKELTRNLLFEKGNISPDFNDNFEIVLIGSLAGGTGSGSFIDVAFAAKNVAKKKVGKIPQMTAMLCLPSAFDGLVSDEREKAYANGYAALKELDYYLNYYDQIKNETSDDFLIDFEWKRNVKEKVSTPPFNNVYLLEDQNLDGKKIGGFEALDDIYKMIAEFLFLDFNESSFSNKKRSLHSNLNVNIGTKTKVHFDDSNYVEYHPNRYSSFGLSQIKLGIDKLKLTASLKLAKDLINLLNNQDVKLTFDNNSWHKYQLDNDALLGQIGSVQRKQLEQRWSKGDSSNSNDKIAGFNEVREAIDNMEFSTYSEKECNSFLNKQAIKINEISSNFHEFISTEIIEENPRFNAKMRESIFGNIRNTETSVKDLCDQQIIKSLSDYKYEGVKFAREFTDSLLQQLERLITSFTHYSEITIKAPDKVQINSSEDNDEYLLLSQHAQESQVLFPLPLFKNYAKRVTTEKLQHLELSYKKQQYNNALTSLNSLNDNVMQMIDESLNQLISLRIIKMLERLKEHFENKRRNLENYDGALKSLSSDFSKEFQRLSKCDDNVRNVELSLDFKEADYEKQLSSSSEYDQLLITYLDEFLNSDDIDNGLTGNTFESLLVACNTYQNNPQKLKKFQECFNNFVKMKTQNFNLSEDSGSAIDLFNTSYQDPQDRNNEIKSLIGYSAPRIRLSDTNSNDIDIKLLGCDSEQTIFIDEIAKLGKHFDSQEFSKDEVVFYNEIIGFPAFRIEIVNNMKEAYNALLLKNPDENWLRHTDKNFDKFPDLIRPSQSEAKERVSKLKPFCLALLTGIVKYQSGKFILLKKDEYHNKVGEPLQNSLLSSAYGLNESQTSLLQRTSGTRYFNSLDMEPERDKRYIELFIALEDIICEASIFQSMLSVSLVELKEEVYIRMLNNLNVIGRTGENLLSEFRKDGIELAMEKYPELVQMTSSIDGMRKNIKNFTLDTGYFEKELGLFTDQNGTSAKGKYFKVLNW